MRRSLSFGLIAAAGLLVLGLTASLARPGPGFAGSHDFKSEAGGIEGLSGLWVSAAGDRLMAVSDRGYVVTAEIRRGAQGRIAGVTFSDRTILRGRKNTDPLVAQMDSEGLAIGPDGEIYVSTEGPARVLRYAAVGGAGQQLGRARDFGDLPKNGALEALAIGRDGTLYAIPETTVRGQAPFPVFARHAGQWSVFATLPREGDYLPVGADVAADGRLYILFRGFSVLQGFSSRLTRYDVTATGLGPPEPLIETPFGLHGNLESVSVWRDTAGQLTATMVSDDNGNFFQSAELVEYHLPD